MYRIAQPGVGIKHYKGRPGTLGAFAVSEDGEILMMTAGHVGTNQWRAKRGDPILLYPEFTSKVKYTQIRRVTSLRIEGVAEHLPAVLKRPKEPQVGMKVIKSGMKTGVTIGEVVDTNFIVDVAYADGRKARFEDQILTTKMGESGDSGSLVLTTDTYEPVGLLFAGNQYLTYCNKLTRVCQEMGIQGFFCPLSIPKGSPWYLQHIVGTIVKDGVFVQKRDLYSSTPQDLEKSLGITSVEIDEHGELNVRYEDMILTNLPIEEGDIGNFLITEDKKVVGIIVGGSDKASVAIKIQRFLNALELDFIKYKTTHLRER